MKFLNTISLILFFKIQVKQCKKIEEVLIYLLISINIKLGDNIISILLFSFYPQEFRWLYLFLPTCRSWLKRINSWFSNNIFTTEVALITLKSQLSFIAPLPLPWMLSVCPSTKISRSSWLARADDNLFSAFTPFSFIIYLPDSNNKSSSKEM